MTSLDPSATELLWHDADAREQRLRRIVTDRLAAQPPPALPDQIVATYFLALRTSTLVQAGKEISYHATSGTKDVPPGSLIEQCTGHAVGVDAFDATGRLGLLHMAYPLKMLLQPDGHLTSTDILHTVAGAILFDVYENQDVRLVMLQIPEPVLRTFPGPAHGGPGVRALTNWDKPGDPTQPAFGTILKPTAGITPELVGSLVEEAAGCSLFLFVKEDENLYPRLDYSPVRVRAQRAVDSIRRAQDQRGGRGLIFAPHITGAPHEILESVQAVLDAGASGVMFSESFALGTVRMVREATRHRPVPPAIYGHNAGIGVRTRGGIWRDVIDLLARLDGIDFRQTAPVRRGTPFIYPHGAEWEASERVLTHPLPGIRPTMIARAGGLDQGNIILNLQDAEQRGLREHILFLAGSAINSMTNNTGQPDPRLGAEAMQQALNVHQSGALRGIGSDEHLAALLDLAERQKLKALTEALRQRYRAGS
ncbi:MAG TPA: RuBisCO large subunit C-terminal-like domain-containing protein [Verrucomicrobiae bacterium]|nr:RuBisCO large subunit C-terminal-like domain-containing protein [Verrucomicrobiae bacterium]